jgi:AmmeMemoRadiSam system protein B
VRKHILLLFLIIFLIGISYLVIDWKLVIGNWKLYTSHSRISNLESSKSIKNDILNPIHPLLFSDQEAFTKAINTAHPFTSDQLKGGIIPHHLVASDNIANFFATMKQSNNATIVLIGPNHYQKGDFDVLTSKFAWDSPYGIVEPDTAIIDELVNRNLAHIDEDTVEHDHSVASFAPFIQYFIPGTKVVPIILKRGFSIEDIEQLSIYLANLTNQCHPGEATTSIGSHYNNCSIFFLASVDFSHYLPKDNAYQKDKFTEELLKGKDYGELYRLNNDYLDSPPSVILLMKTMEKLRADNLQIFAHTNSANYPNSDQKNTTSHFVVGFW